MTQALMSHTLARRGDSIAVRRSDPLDSRRFPSRAKLALRLLERLQSGTLAVTFPDGQHASYGPGHGPQADIILSDWRCFDAAFKSGDIGFAETWIDGDWTTSDLGALLGLFVANRNAIEHFVYGTAWGRLFYRLRHLLNRNSRTGSRRNIHAHYDIGNAFYRLWLDPTMTYSSALFGDGAAPDENKDGEYLLQAQQAKYRRLLDMLRLRAGDSVLEIGCGWGGFAETALRAGLNVTGLTLSTEQLAWARARCEAVATADAHTDLRLQDYRDCHGRFDGIVSIEMFEAVGERYWPSYFDTIKRTLKPDGRACIQTIVIADALFERYRKGTDFIQQYIFPGGMLPSPAVFRQQAERAGLKIVDTLAFGQDYARTLKVWRKRFSAALPAIRALGLDDAFIRIWTFYLCYCEAAFRHRNTDVVQFTLEHATPAPRA
ncbi:MAG TPA: cyclopropane-fatty-acyl-phospholipid synthase family protein [Pseudogulbenkiania sp.]|nr:cyclopropane-fatty-acyl-phospholipid synthase family protein [Pseudogulbenkiania sp.]